jgi:hypothetical protein
VVVWQLCSSVRRGAGHRSGAGASSLTPGLGGRQGQSQGGSGGHSAEAGGGPGPA